METETTRTNDSEEEKDNADTRHPRREYPSRLTLCETLVRGNEEARELVYFVEWSWTH